MEKIKKILREVGPIEVDYSIGCREGNSYYWMEGEVIQYSLHPERGICIQVKSPERGTNWISHNFYCEIQNSDDSDFERHIKRLEKIIETHGIKSFYDFSNWEVMPEE